MGRAGSKEHVKVGGGYSLELSLWVQDDREAYVWHLGANTVQRQLRDQPDSQGPKKETLTCEVRTKVHSGQQEEVLLGGSVSSLPDRKFSKLLKLKKKKSTRTCPV